MKEQDEFRNGEEPVGEEDLVWSEETASDEEDLDWQEENDRRKLYNKLRVKEEGAEGDEPEAEPGEDAGGEIPGDRDERLQFLREQTRKAEAEHNSSAAKKRERERKRDRVRSIFVAVAMILVFLPAVILHLRSYRFTTYSVDGELSLGAVGTSKIYAFADGNVVLGNDTVLYVEDMNIVWSSLVSLEHPIYAAEGDYFAIADRGGYQFHICDRTGLLSTIRVSRKIRCMDISAAGVVAVSTESSDSSYVSYFDRFGTKISVEVKTVLDASGYPVSLSVSPDGQKLLMVYYCVQNGIGESRIAVYDFKNGRQDKSYIIASYEDFYNTDTYLAECRFLDDRHAVVVGDNELVFLSDFQKNSVQRTTVPLTEKIRSVFFTARHLVLIDDAEEGTYCRFFDATGDVESRFLCPSRYDAVIADEEFVLFRYRAEITLYNVSGVERYNGVLTFEPQAVSFAKGHALLLNTGSKFQKITLK